MMKRPFVFFTEDYSRYLSNGEGTDLSGSLQNIVAEEFPFVKTVFFSDKWGNVVNRQIDTVSFIGTNLKNATIETADWQGNYTPAWTITGNTESDFMMKLPAPITTSSVRITIPEEDNPAQVNVGKIGVYSYLCDLLALTDANFKKNTNQGQYRTVSGDMVYYGDYDKMEIKLKADNLPKNQFDLLTAQIDESNLLTVLPFYNETIGKVYECYVLPEYSFSLDRKTELYSLDLELKEL